MVSTAISWTKDGIRISCLAKKSEMKFFGSALMPAVTGRHLLDSEDSEATKSLPPHWDSLPHEEKVGYTEVTQGSLA